MEAVAESTCVLLGRRQELQRVQKIPMLLGRIPTAPPHGTSKQPFARIGRAAKEIYDCTSAEQQLIKTQEASPGAILVAAGIPDPGPETAEADAEQQLIKNQETSRGAISVAEGIPKLGPDSVKSDAEQQPIKKQEASPGAVAVAEVGPEIVKSDACLSDSSKPCCVALADHKEMWRLAQSAVSRTGESPKQQALHKDTLKRPLPTLLGTIGRDGVARGIRDFKSPEKLLSKKQETSTDPATVALAAREAFLSRQRNIASRNSCFQV
eukprot:TRINITY_DN11995_c0_g1_i1.p1 TRINITY_DN11995_c0_g1~~TRINITY_DN11995_c0_g1_i1.p1  ORF type:complete len:285 (+),score=67.20 TRINITY_DN11995_c0_g1_i1:56-856(+)